MPPSKLGKAILGETSDSSERTRKSDQTRQEILEAALEFLWTHPFRDLSVRELMSNTESSRSAFYQYFADLYELSETLLRGLELDIFQAATPWFHGEGAPEPLLEESLGGLVQICYERGPILRAVSDAAVSDERLEQQWNAFLSKFDDAVEQKIAQHQSQELIPQFDPRPIAIALNRMDASLLIEAFGRRPRQNPEPVLAALIRIWRATLYDADK